MNTVELAVTLGIITTPELIAFLRQLTDTAKQPQ